MKENLPYKTGSTSRPKLPEIDNSIDIRTQEPIMINSILKWIDSMVEVMKQMQLSDRNLVSSRSNGDSNDKFRSQCSNRNSSAFKFLFDVAHGYEKQKSMVE